MRTISINETMNKSKFNAFYLGIFIVCFFAMIFDGYDFQVYGTVVVPLIKSWHINPTVAGLLGSYGLFGMLIGAIGFGMIADKVGRKQSILIGVTAYCIFNGLIGLSQTPGEFGFFRFLGGLGLGGVMPNVISLMTEYSPFAYRAMMIASVFAGIQIGSMAGPALAIGALPVYGWRIMFLVAFIPLILVPFLWAYLPESMTKYLRQGNKDKIRQILQKANPEYVPEENDDYCITSPVAERASLASLFKGGLARSTILIWITYFMDLFMIFALSVWLPKLMMSKGYAMGSALAMLLIWQLAPFIFTFIGGRISDMVGCKRVLVVLFLLASVTIALLSIKSGTGVTLLLICLSGTAVSGGMNILHAHASQSYPSNLQPAGVGWGLGVGRAGAILAPTFGGLLLTAHAGMTTIFFAFAVPGIVAAIAVGLSPDKYRNADVSCSVPVS